MANKQNKQIMIGSLILIIILALVYFPLDAPLSVAYQGQCSLPSCPSGYSFQEKNCEGKTCYGICEKPVPAYCGYYGGVKTITNSFFLTRKDQGVSFITPKVYESSSKCLTYRAGAQLDITNRDPGGFLHADSESHKLTFGISSLRESKCSTSTGFWGWTNWKDIGRGSSGNAAGVWGYYNSYKDTSCGTTSYGSEGKILLTLQYREAEWIDDEVITQEVECFFECNSNSDCGSTGFTGSKRCSGENVVQNFKSSSCSNFQCDLSDEEKIVEFCDFGCESGGCIQKNRVNYYRLSNDQCSLVQIYDSDKTFNDYTTLSECEGKIQEQDILIYRLEDNCNSVYIKVSQRTDNDYDTRSECMEAKDQKVKYYRLEDNKCNEIFLYPSDTTWSDHLTLSDCESAINGEGDPSELIVGGIVVLLLIVFLIVWLVRRK